ncbi:unnamed protein product [Dracunculus medinensis]|uniref:Protein quiver n=1 Tax=Dracunculus medinensis TaxID=318479 RepID=A0A0N4UD58_DRAME|nr:unnamed protein product [Dracunculus medinensis]
MLAVVILLILTIHAQKSIAITCYKCSSDGGEDCLSRSTSCSYGFFGCIKTVTYSGGLDKMGNNEPNLEKRIISMNRDCTILPITGVDICRQVSFLGYRLQTCYCFNDFCNCASLRTLLFSFLFIVIFHIFYLILL